MRMVSTFHKDEMTEVQVWRKGHNIRVTKEKPSCVVEYNAHMNGVDKLDQNIAYYPFVRRSNKWTNKFIVYLFQVAMFNSFVLYRAKHPQGTCKSMMSFMDSVIKAWTSLRNASRAPHTDPQSRLSGNKAHVLVRVPHTPKKRLPTRCCKVCRANKKRKDKVYL